MVDGSASTICCGTMLKSITHMPFRFLIWCASPEITIFKNAVELTQGMHEKDDGYIYRQGGTAFSPMPAIGAV